MTDTDDEILVQLRCPHCKAELQRTLHYIRTYRVTWCESCGGEVIYGKAAVERAEELLRRMLN